jgi:transcriptional regulator with XRE-family HTH domain
MSNKKFNKVNTDSSLQLGKTIKAERLNQKISLDQLSHLSGVSKGMLSQIEQGKTNPTVGVLYKIANGLHVEPTRLLPAALNDPRVWRVIRATDDRYVFSKNEHCKIRTLSPLDLEKQIEFYEVKFGPKGELKSEPHYQGTEEILTVSQGHLIIRSGKSETEVHPGDSIHYAADVTHSISNIENSSATIYLLVKYKS